jgi:mono/diheme cytochrome c family protein
MMPLRSLPALALLTLLFAVAGCDSGPAAPKSDEELHLTPQQASGRRVYEAYCAACHEAYRDKAKHGPPLLGLYKKPAMPSGAPANDERVRDTIALGRAKMPGFSAALSEEQVQDLIAYLHTL